MRLPRLIPGLRTTATIHFGLGALIGCLLIALGTYLTARHYLVTQREQEAVRQAGLDASYFMQGMLTQRASVPDALAALSPPSGTHLVVFREGRWYSSTVSTAADQIPASVREGVSAGSLTYAWTSRTAGAVLAVGVPLPGDTGHFYEVIWPRELDATLSTLRWVLSSFAVAGMVVGAIIGTYASRRLVRPLDGFARTAQAIGAGNLTLRLPPTADPDLRGIVDSFNLMVDALDERIRRDARFAADVGHELRSPLTTLSTSVEVLQERRHELSPSGRTALDLVSAEVERFARTLEDLIELGRLDAGVESEPPARLDAVELLRQTLLMSGRPLELLHEARCDATDDAEHTVDASESGGFTHGEGLPVSVDKHRIARALINLLENADRHGEGVTAVRVRRCGQEVLLDVVDRGPGVEPADRERIFERFTRGAGERRGSLPGSGLGLSIVAESVAADGGRVWCAPNQDGPGTTFTVALPLAGEPGS